MTESEYILAGNTARLDAAGGALKGMIFPDRKSRKKLAEIHRLLSDLWEETLNRCDVVDEGEEWLVKPEMRDGNPRLWSPGVKLGVRPGSWYHRTECFGPVLGLMCVGDLDEAIVVQNSSDFGLTGGLHSLDPKRHHRCVPDAEDHGLGFSDRHGHGGYVDDHPDRHDRICGIRRSRHGSFDRGPGFEADESLL